MPENPEKIKCSDCIYENDKKCCDAPMGHHIYCMDNDVPCGIRKVRKSQ